MDRAVCGKKGRARAKDDQSIANVSVLKWSKHYVRTYLFARLDHRYTFSRSEHDCMAFLDKRFLDWHASVVTHARRT